MECPKCGQKTPDQDAECCNCGIVIEKYIKQKIAKNCPYCAELVLNNAIKCKHCGEFFVQPDHKAETKKESPSLPMLGRALIDFSVSEYITPDIIKIIYALGVIIFFLGAAGTFAILTYNGHMFMAFISFLICLLGIVALRIGVELVLLAFNPEKQNIPKNMP